MPRGGETSRPVGLPERIIEPEKKDSSLDRLERRILLAAEAHKEIMAIRADLPPAEVAVRLDEIQGRISKAFPAAVQRKFFRYERERERLNFLLANLDDLSETDFEERKEIEAADPRYAEMSKLFIREEKFKADDDVFFFVRNSAIDFQSQGKKPDCGKSKERSKLAFYLCAAKDS
jgi:hypothetical protein